MHARGEDARLTVMVDGREELVFRSLESIDIDFGTTTQEFNYVGAQRPETDEINGPARLTFRINPDSPGFGRLVAYRLDRAQALETRSNVRIDISCAVDFGDAGRDRWRFPDVKLEAMSTGSSGRNARVTGAMTAICDNPSRMA